MPNHRQGQKNANDVGAAYIQFQDLTDRHMPTRTGQIINQAYAVTTKRNLWP